MPRGTVSTDTTHVDLKSCPGGWVELRQLPFGKMLTRRDKASRMLQELDPKSKPGDVAKVQIDILNEWSNHYDFKNCIIDHNIEDENGNKLDFANPMTFDILDPKIGSEIERAIGKLNTEDFDEEGFTLPSGRSSMDENQTSSNGSDLGN